MSDAPPAAPKRSRMTLAILGAMALGLVVGPLLGESAAPFGELGKLVIQLIKAVATPLLFFAIVNAVVSTQVAARSGLRMLGFAMVNATLALGVGLLASNLFEPGRHLSIVIGPADPAALTAWADKRVDLLQTFSSYVPQSVVAPFVDNAVIPVVLMALLTGFGLRAVRHQQRAEGGSGHAVVEAALRTLQQLMEVVLGWAVKLVPVAVFGVVCKTVGQYGFAPLKGLAAYVAVGLLGFAFHALVTYQLWVGLWARISLRRFWAAAREPMVTALGTNSSLATLPVTLQALDRLGVSKEASALGACVGTNLNNDGILLYEGMAVLFVAQALGIEMTASQQVLACLTCVVAAMGVAGVPEAGFVSLALVLNTVGLPIELLPLLLTVDWVLARGRSVVNVLSDMVLSILVDGRRHA
jgi:Na+/H+-dicarboxylate symporter